MITRTHAGRARRTSFDALLPGLPAAVVVLKPLSLSANRVRWLKYLSGVHSASRKDLCRAWDERGWVTYRTWCPLLEHGLIEAKFDDDWHFAITAKGRQMLEQLDP